MAAVGWGGVAAGPVAGLGSWWLGVVRWVWASVARGWCTALRWRCAAAALLQLVAKWQGRVALSHQNGCSLPPPHTAGNACHGTSQRSHAPPHRPPASPAPFAAQVPCDDLERGLVTGPDSELQTLPHVPMALHASW